MSTHDDIECLTISKTAKLLKTSRNTVMKLIRNGNLKATKLPVCGWRVLKTSVKALLPK